MKTVLYFWTTPVNVRFVSLEYLLNIALTNSISSWYKIDRKTRGSLGSYSPSYPSLIANSSSFFFPGAERNNELPLLCNPPISYDKLQCPLFRPAVSLNNRTNDSDFWFTLNMLKNKGQLWAQSHHLNKNDHPYKSKV